MRVISTTDISREGNDCYIYESVSLVEQFGVMAVVLCQRVTGWAEREGAYVLHHTANFYEALEAYKHYGGKLDEAISID
jgi:hypothetical protein